MIDQTNLHNQDARFSWIAEHGGPVVSWADKHRHRLDGVDDKQEWHAHDFDCYGSSIPVTCTNSDESIEIGLRNSGGISWSAYKTVCTKPYKFARASGEAATWPEALEAARAGVPKPMQLAGFTWWQTGKDSFVTWANGREIEMHRVDFADDSESAATPWFWRVSGNSITAEEGAAAAVWAWAGGQPG